MLRIVSVILITCESQRLFNSVNIPRVGVEGRQWNEVEEKTLIRYNMFVHTRNYNLKSLIKFSFCCFGKISSCQKEKVIGFVCECAQASRLISVYLTFGQNNKKGIKLVLFLQRFIRPLCSNKCLFIHI